MTGIFMFILFLLNIITIFAVIVLYLRQNRFIQAEKDQKAMMAEMEALMSGYIMEMKEENEALLDKLMDNKQPLGKKESFILKEMIDPIQDIHHYEEQNPPHLSKTKKKEAAKAYKNQSLTTKNIKVENVSKEEDRLELSVESEIKEPTPEKASFTETLQASLNGQSVQEPSFHEQVNSLAKQGLSAEQIAQNLKCGKTEVELLLKFQTSQ